jgi:hypothetical protein
LQHKKAMVAEVADACIGYFNAVLGDDGPPEPSDLEMAEAAAGALTQDRMQQHLNAEQLATAAAVWTALNLLVGN